jgi:predicted Zn-dependent protease
MREENARGVEERMLSVGDDWFRGAAWDDRARSDFEARLARARPHNRQQYLRVKAVSLRAAGNGDAAWQLFERVADYSDGSLHETVFAWEALADMAVERGDPATAERLYRRILADQPSLSGTTGRVELSLAELLLDTGRPEARDEASALLSAWLERPGMKFDNDLFRWHLALIRAAEAIGDRETVQRAANTALTLADRGPQPPGRPDVGRARTDEATLNRLCKLVQ